jgi:fatty acid desaturase
LKLLAVVGAVFSSYRAVVFIHEIAHGSCRRIRGFRIVWNLLCGIPLLMPDFLYASHRDHHALAAYGTLRDAEYWPWGRSGNRLMILAFLLSSFAAMPVAVARFGLLAPLSWVNRGTSGWVVRNASALAVHFGYRRAPLANRARRDLRLQEAGCFVYLVGIAVSLRVGWVGGELLLQLYLIASAALLMNALRTLAAHRYRSAGVPLTRTEQMVDSINHARGSWLTALWAPVGLRFHALHHLFPTLPYHNLAAAHRRLIRLLPPGSSYHFTEGGGLVETLRGLWLGAGRLDGAVRQMTEPAGGSGTASD